MARKNTAHDEPTHDAPTKGSVHSEEALTAAARRHRCPVECAGAWCDYDVAMLGWQHRCADLLMDMLASPARYMTLLKRAYQAIHKRTMSSALEEEFADALEHNRMELLYAYPGASWVWIANEICGEHGGGFDFDTVTRLSLLHWLPARPSSPNAQPRHRPENDEERMARADRIAAGMVGPPEPVIDRPAPTPGGRAVDISDGPEYEESRADLR